MSYVAGFFGMVFAVLLARRLMRIGEHTVSLGLTALLALIPGWFAWQTHQLESQLAEAVQIVSGVPDAEVDCQGFLREFRLDNNLGEVRFGRDGVPSKVAGLRGGVCDNLSDWLSSDKLTPSQDQIIAVHVLTHEAIHVSGLTDERGTECQAMQRDAETAQILGATPEQATMLATRYTNEVYPRMPNGYTTPGCVENGEYDGSPDDGYWP